MASRHAARQWKNLNRFEYERGIETWQSVSHALELYEVGFALVLLTPRNDEIVLGPPHTIASGRAKWLSDVAAILEEADEYVVSRTMLCGQEALSVKMRPSDPVR